MVRASFMIKVGSQYMTEWVTGWINKNFGCYKSNYGGWHVIKLDCGLSVSRVKSCKEAKALCKKLDN